MATDRLTAAHEWVSHGRIVVPCINKRPMVKWGKLVADTPRAERVPSEAEARALIDQWWTEHPTA